MEIEVAQHLTRRLAAVVEELDSARGHLRRFRREYALIDRSKFARVQSVFRLALDAAGLRRGKPAQTLTDTDEYVDTTSAEPVSLASTTRSEYQSFLSGVEARESDLALHASFLRYLPYQPTISIIVPVYDTSEDHLIGMIESVINQTYPNWQLCLADDNSPSPHIRTILDMYVERDHRIVIDYREENGHISAASNSALALATGEYVGLLDHDDVLTPDALFHVILALNDDRTIDMVYSDEDKLAETGERYEPFFKPDWSPEAFLSRMYTCHFGVFRRTLLEKIGGFRAGFDGSQDYDLVLRFTELTDKVRHIPRILYSWRVHALSAASGVDAKPYAYVAAQKALSESLERRGEPGRIEHVIGCSGLYVPRFDLTRPGKVSIIIPTRDRAEDLARCLTSVFTSSWPDFEIILVDNGTKETQALKVIDQWTKWSPEKVKVLELDEPFNFSRLINAGVAASTGTYLMLLNNDTEVVTRDWLEKMMEQAQRPKIGAVGCKLTYPDGKIQHAGIILGLGGAAGHGHYKFHDFDNGYFGALKTVNNYSAVTAACMMVRREAFDAVGGFDEAFSIAYNDVDFCLKLRASGLRNVYLPHVELHHHESVSRGSDLGSAREERNNIEQDLLIDRWNLRTTPDPYYNVNLALTDPDYRLASRAAHRMVFRDDRLLEAGAGN